MADGAGTIDSLSIEIGASSTKAAEEVKKLADSLKELKSAQKSVKSGNSGTKNTIQNIGEDSALAMSKIELLKKKVDLLKKDLGTKISLGKIDDKGIVNAALQIKNVQNQIEKATVKPKVEAVKQFVKESDVRMAGGETARGVVMSTSQMADEMMEALSPAISLKKQIQIIKDSFQNSKLKKAANAFASALKSASNYAGKLAKNISGFAKKKIKLLWDKSAVSGLEKSIGRIKNVINSFGRIAFYRAIRSAIKYVTDALKEGVENAYHYAREFGDATSYIADAYDRISSSEFKMSNQLGAGWATMIAYIEPVIVRIINLVTKAADAITQFFALMSGKGTYLKAVDYNKQWAESATGAAKAAKEWKNQLMGFDEINRLEEPSDGGGGGSGASVPDYSGMFEEAPVNDFFAEIRKAFESGEWAKLGTLLGQKFNEIVDSIKWAEYGQNLGKGLQASITTAYTFLKTADFKNLGSRISEFVNNALEQVNFSRLGRLWMRMRTALWDVIYGAVVNLNWVEVANKLSDFVIGALDELEQWLENLEPDKIAKALKDFFGNIKYSEIGQALHDVLKEAVDFAVGVLDELGLDGKTIKAIVEIVGGLATLILAIKGVATVVGTVKTALGLLTSPIGLVVLGITALIAAGVLLYKNWDTVKEKLSSIWQIIKEKADYYFGDMFDGIKQKVEGIIELIRGIAGFVAGVFTGDWKMAWEGVKDIFNGACDVIIGTVKELFGWIRGLIQACADGISWLRGLFEWENAVSSKPITDSRIKADTKQYDINNFLGGFASGGFPEDGLFMANHGELVGEFSNGRTAVANNEQIVEGIRQGVYDAVMAANSNGERQVDVRVYLDSREIKIGQNRLSRAMGV